MAATFIFLSLLRTNTPSCIDLAMATLTSANTLEMKKWEKNRKGFPKKELSQDRDSKAENKGERRGQT